jgi:hypothetical protein
MPISHPISVGDGVRIVAILDAQTTWRLIAPPDELVGHFGTVAAVLDRERFDEPTLYVVRTSLDDATHALVADELMLTRRARYDVDDVVELYSEPIHEGPHPDDEHTPVRIASVLDVHVHPNNDEWVVGYTVEEWFDDSSSDVLRVKPGAIARLHTTKGANR